LQNPSTQTRSVEQTSRAKGFPVMSFQKRALHLCAACVLCLLSSVAAAQAASTSAASPPPPESHVSPAQDALPSANDYPTAEAESYPLPADAVDPGAVTPPDPAALRTVPQAPLTEGAARAVPASGADEPGALEAAPGRGPMLDGRPRQGAFLAGPGSLTFIAHHTLLGAGGGLFTQGFANDFRFDRSSREAMLAGTLIGAGVGFGLSSWWQFNHWVDRPMANIGVANSLMGGMFAAGFLDLFDSSPSVLTWSAFLGAELGAWLTAGIGGGQMQLNDGLLITSGGAWAAIYSALLIGIVHFSGSKVSGKTALDTLLITPGIGAAALALASMRYHPTSSQILRADAFGAGVGAAVLGLSALVLGGFRQPTPYVLSLLGSVGAITTVSLLWEESAERPSGYSMRSSKILYW